jgi:hypothetical protein
MGYESHLLRRIIRLCISTALIVCLTLIVLFVNACSSSIISSFPSHTPSFLFPREVGYEEGYTITPIQHWKMSATEEQVEQISELWGKSITFSDLMNDVFPEVAKELPGELLGYPLKIQWPTSSIDWNKTLYDGYVTTVTGATITSGTPESIVHPGIEGAYGFYYFIGKAHLEALPKIPLSTANGIPYYFVSIYIAN